MSAASEELQKLGLQSIPVIGLAKEFEEIYFQDKSEPLRLGLDHPATLEQIAEVPGFGGKAAEELKKFLDARG